MEKMHNKITEELVDIAMSFLNGADFEQERFQQRLKKLGYTFGMAAEYVASQLENIGKFPQSCIFIEADKDFGSKACKFYKELNQGDVHCEVCTGQYTVKQRWSGGGPYNINEETTVERIPIPCQGPFKTLFTERLKKAMEGYLFGKLNK